MSERILQLGPDQHLTALWTPAEGTRRPWVVLILNAGVIHRVGPHRTSVKLARHLARQGFGCMRFDLSGVGDSRAPRGAADFRTQAVRDIQTVMDAIEREQGATRFALVGICSGAVNAQAAAVADPRIGGAFMVDGMVYPTSRTRWHFALTLFRAYGTALFLGKAWRFVTRQRAAEPAQPAAPADDTPTERTREGFAQDMAQLTGRGVSVALMFTGSILELYAYPGQLRDAFPGAAWLDRVHCLFTPEVDHTITTLGAQARFLELVTDWASALGGAPSGPR